MHAILRDRANHRSEALPCTIWLLVNLFLISSQLCTHIGYGTLCFLPPPSLRSKRIPTQSPRSHPRMTSENGLICFTNCLLPLEDGSLVEKDLWIDERRGVILDSQVRKIATISGGRHSHGDRSQRTFFLRKERPAKIIDLGGNVLRSVHIRRPHLVYAEPGRPVLA